MKITDVTTHLLSSNWAAIDEQWEDTGGGYKSSALVRVETDAGITGLGEVIIGYFAPEAVPTLVDYYHPAPHRQGPAPGRARSGTGCTSRRKWWGRSGRGRVGHLSGIDIALWDI